MTSNTTTPTATTSIGNCVLKDTKEQIQPQRHWEIPHRFSIQGNDDQKAECNNNNNNNNIKKSNNGCNAIIKDEDAIAKAFFNDGFIILDQVLDSSLLNEWKIFAREYFKECFQIMFENGHTKAPTHFDDKVSDYVLGHGAKHGFREIVMRSPGRYELSLLGMLQHGEQKHSKQITTSLPSDIQNLLRPLETLLPKLLSATADCDPTRQQQQQQERKLSDLKLCHLSLLISAPNSSDQGWHADGGHVNIQKHLPCHCYNIFIPLQDIPLEMGPTEFRPGGHFLTRNLGPMMLAAKCRKTLRQPVWPALKTGDVAIFDYRVLHRGRANTTNECRDVLVLSYCEPWFEDILNFPKRSMMEPAM